MDNGICPECGAQNMPENTYCANCGARISAAEAPPENAPSSPVLIDGNPVSSVVEFVGKNSREIIPKLLHMEQNNSKISWCWPPFLLGLFFGPLGIIIWFLYRKMFKPACIFGALIICVDLYLEFSMFSLSINDFFSFLSFFADPKKALFALLDTISLIFSSLFEILADLNAMNWAIALLLLLSVLLLLDLFLPIPPLYLFIAKINDSALNNAIYTKFFVRFSLAILIGLFGMYLYKKHIAKSLKKRSALPLSPVLIGGNPVSRVAGFVGKNSARIIPKLLRMEQKGSKISWCWSLFLLGLFLGPLGVMLWFLYRKMYKPACLFGAIGALVFGIRFAISAYEQAASSVTLHSVVYEFAALTASFFALFLGPDALGSIVHIDSIKDVNDYTTFFNAINHTAVLLDFACAILIGLFGMYLYKKHIAKNINKPSPISDGQNASKPIGGTSALAVIIGIIIAIIAVSAIDTITSGILGRPEFDIFYSDGSVKRITAKIGIIIESGSISRLF